MPTQTPRPNCNRLSRSRDQIMHVIEFIEWCDEQNIVLAKLESLEYEDSEGVTRKLPERYYSIRETTEQLLHRMLEIDPVELENERRAMLEECRNSGE